MEIISQYNSLFNPCYNINSKNLHYLYINNENCELIYEKSCKKLKIENYKGEIILSGVYINNVFLLNDVLYKNGEILSPDIISYDTRFIILNNIYNKFTCKENLILEIHPIITNNIVKNIFLHNFKYKNFYKTDINVDVEIVEKKILKDENYPEIYIVYNINTNDNEGLLNLKTNNDVLKFKIDYENSQDKIFNCIFDTTFNKWTIN